jgi:hypothetical protein
MNGTNDAVCRQCGVPAVLEVNLGGDDIRTQPANRDAESCKMYDNDTNVGKDYDGWQGN